MNTIFHFQATAAAASGTLTAPFQEQIEVAAATTLPPGGGYGSARVDNFRHREIISIKEAYSYVTGSHSETNKTFRTAATSVIVGLNILDVVTADRVVVRLTSRKKDDGSEASIIPLGSRFENLRIAGKRIDGLDRLATRLFSEFDTFEKIGAKSKETKLQEHLSDSLLLNRKDEVAEPLRKYLPKRGAGFDINRLVSGGVLSCSLAPNLEKESGEFTAAGHVIHLEHFGVIRLAEMQSSHGQRRLTMLSVDLGCPFEGNLSLCYAGSNGSIWG